MSQKLSAFYSTADVGLATLMQDRMNLVCKAYIASNTDDKGVLILSEMAGASRGLQDAIVVNLIDISAVSMAIKE